MASNKSRIPAVPQVNRPKLLRKPSSKCSLSEELSSRNSKRQVAPSHIGDGSEDQDEIFRPWRNLSNPLDNATEENEEDGELKEDGSIATGKKNLTWSDEMDAVLVDGLLDQMEKGQKVDDTFTSTALSTVAGLVGTKWKILGLSILNIKNRLKTLEKNYYSAKKFLSQSGFGFNESTQMLEAATTVWDTYIAANPDAKSFRYKLVVNYYKLDLLFGKDRATGSNSAGPKERQSQWAKEAGNSSDGASMPTNEESTSSFPVKDRVEPPKRAKNRAIEFVCDELRSLRSSIDAVAKALENGNARNYTEEQLYDEISEVTG